MHVYAWEKEKLCNMTPQEENPKIGTEGSLHSM